jgi:hypothetical protein
MQLFAKTITGKTIPLHLQGSDDVAHVKATIQKREGIPPDQQSIYSARGQLLEDGQTLNDCGIQAESQLQLRLVGDAPPRSGNTSRCRIRTIAALVALCVVVVVCVCSGSSTRSGISKFQGPRGQEPSMPCPGISPPANASWDGANCTANSTKTPGESCTAHCDAGFQRAGGSEEYMCKTSTTWGGGGLRCEPSNYSNYSNYSWVLGKNMQSCTQVCKSYGGCLSTVRHLSQDGLAGVVREGIVGRVYDDKHRCDVKDVESSTFNKNNAYAPFQVKQMKCCHKKDWKKCWKGQGRGCKASGYTLLKGFHCLFSTNPDAISCDALPSNPSNHFPEFRRICPCGPEPCASSPCQHGATCINDGFRYKCI